MLPERLASYVNYFEHVALQPPNHWNGFYVTHLEHMNFGLRFQLAFPCYALGALCLHPQAEPDEQSRCRAAMAALIDRMLQRRVWAYWSARAEQLNFSPDPIAHGNAQYSGHLAMMIGMYRAVGGDDRYEQAFTLHWSHHERFTHTHRALVEALHRQMQENDHHGVECDPGQVRVTSMAHVMWANALYDGLYGTRYAEAHTRWVDTVQQRLILRGPRLFGQGIFNPSYASRMRLIMPLGLSLVDAWTLAFMAQLTPELVNELVPRFWRFIRHIPNKAENTTPQAYIPAPDMWKSREIADQTLTTGFSYLLAVEMENADLAAALLNYADHHFDLTEQDGQRWYSSGLSVVFTTALFALGEAGGLRVLGALLPQAAAADTTHGADEAADETDAGPDTEREASA